MTTVSREDQKGHILHPGFFLDIVVVYIILARNLDNLFSELPVTLTFFNSNGDHGLNFITPLFCIIGFTIDCLCLDVMHIMDLGITQWIEGAVFMRLLLNNFC